MLPGFGDPFPQWDSDLSHWIALSADGSSFFSGCLTLLLVFQQLKNKTPSRWILPVIIFEPYPFSYIENKTPITKVNSRPPGHCKCETSAVYLRSAANFGPVSCYPLGLAIMFVGMIMTKTNASCKGAKLLRTKREKAVTVSNMFSVHQTQSNYTIPCMPMIKIFWTRDCKIKK